MRTRVEELQQRIVAGKIKRARPWQGADVVIVITAPEPSEGGFYPDPRFVETPHVEELSWVFRELRDIFQEADGFGAWKEELFGRLGNVANGFTSISPDGTARGLLLAVTEEALTMADEISRDGSLVTLMITSDNRILDDYRLVSDYNVYLTQEAVEKRIDMYVGGWKIELDRPATEDSDDSGRDSEGQGR